MSKFINKEGERYSRLVVQCLFTTRIDPKGRSRAVWGCLCDCGNLKEVSGDNLVSGQVRSCGCLLGDAQILRRNPDAAINVVLNEYKNAARKRGHVFSLTSEEFKDFTSGDCYYCGASPANVTPSAFGYVSYTHNGIDRKDNSQGYTRENCVSCCSRCNYFKHKMNHDEFMELIQVIHKKHFGAIQ